MEKKQTRQHRDPGEFSPINTSEYKRMVNSFKIKNSQGYPLEQINLYLDYTQNLDTISNSET